MGELKIANCKLKFVEAQPKSRPAAGEIGGEETHPSLPSREGMTTPVPPLLRGTAVEEPHPSPPSSSPQGGTSSCQQEGMTKRNIKMIVAYDGTCFHGWQRQRGQRTVQQEVETAISRVVCERVALVAASRTDAGVHARGQTAHFRTATIIPCDRLLCGINSSLPDSIAVMQLDDVAPEFSSRNATGKHYQYRICRDVVDDPFSRRSRWRCVHALDISLMREAARLMTGDVDFRGLQVKTGKDYETTIRTIWAIELQADDHELVIDVYGKAFMYKQVRSMVGLLVAAGRGRAKIADIPALLSGTVEKRRSEVAPPQGLTLMKVYYGDQPPCGNKI